MKFPKSEHLGTATAPDGAEYRCEFYGEDEGAAVVVGPRPPSGTGMQSLPEVHREPATSASDALIKLRAWRRERGWT